LAGFPQETVPLVQFPPFVGKASVPLTQRLISPRGTHQHAKAQQQHPAEDGDPDGGHRDWRDIPPRRLGSTALPVGCGRGACPALPIVFDMCAPTTFRLEEIVLAHRAGWWLSRKGIRTGSELVFLPIQRACRRSPSMSTTVIMRRLVRT
jgi:hypothetical protein